MKNVYLKQRVFSSQQNIRNISKYKNRKEDKNMQKTKKYQMDLDKRILITTEELQSLLGVGRYSAVKTGEQALAKVQIGRRVLWSVAKVNEYIRELAA